MAINTQRPSLTRLLVTQFSLGHPRPGPRRAVTSPLSPLKRASLPQAHAYKPRWDVTWWLSTVLQYTMVVALTQCRGTCESNHFGVFFCVFILALNYAKPAPQPRWLWESAVGLRGWTCRWIMLVFGEAIILHWHTQVLNYRGWNYCTIPVVFLGVPYCLIEKFKFIEKTEIKGDKDCSFSLKI